MSLAGAVIVSTPQVLFATNRLQQDTDTDIQSYPVLICMLGDLLNCLDEYNFYFYFSVRWQFEVLPYSSTQQRHSTLLLSHASQLHLCAQMLVCTDPATHTMHLQGSCLVCCLWLCLMLEDALSEFETTSS